MTRLEDSC